MKMSVNGATTVCRYPSQLITKLSGSGSAIMDLMAAFTGEKDSNKVIAPF